MSNPAYNRFVKAKALRDDAQRVMEGALSQRDFNRKWAFYRENSLRQTKTPYTNWRNDPTPENLEALVASKFGKGYAFDVQ